MNRTRCVVLLLAVLWLAGYSCNKNSLELPPLSPPKSELRLQAKVNGIAILEFVFEKTTISGGDTVWLSVKNVSGKELKDIRYVTELCAATLQNFDNCSMQFSDTIKTLNANGDAVGEMKWINAGLVLDSHRINVGVLSIGGEASHPLNGIYGNVSASFEGEDTAVKYYGQVRGYVLADGAAVFRFKSAFTTNLNAIGLFSGMDAFDGKLITPDVKPITYRLDSIGTAGARKLIDTSDGKCTFRLKFDGQLDDEIHSILSITSKQ